MDGQIVEFLVSRFTNALQVKALALDLAEITSFMQRRQNEESRVQQDIQNAFKDISR